MARSELHREIVIIGAGPSGALAAALLRRRGHDVLVLEKQHFPRFSIGESLLPQCMEFMELAGMLPAVEAENFQFKNGAAFHYAGRETQFDFRQKFSPGWGTTFQVQRARFDQILAEQAEKDGADIRFGHEITAVNFEAEKPVLQVRTDTGEEFTVSCRFVLDGSGFGRVLPRLLDMEAPSTLPVRTSLFTHIEDRINPDQFDREKILITIHPDQRDVWFWLIPFSNGRASVGVVATGEFLQGVEGDCLTRLRSLADQDPNLGNLLRKANWDTPAREITGYTCNVTSLWGQNFALLGNAGEFLDPVFSSGVTIAMKSAFLAATLLDRQLRGESVNWETEYAQPLQAGVDTFRTFVEAWYDSSFQEVIFAEHKSAKIREMISSILAGYAWDTENPYVKDNHRLAVLAEACGVATGEPESSLL